MGYCYLTAVVDHIEVYDDYEDVVLRLIGENDETVSHVLVHPDRAEEMIEPLKKAVKKARKSKHYEPLE